MAIAYRCPQCQFSHTAPESLAGQTVTCSFCDSPVVVPGAAAVSDDPFLPPIPGRKPVVAASLSDATAPASVPSRAAETVVEDDPFAPPTALPADGRVAKPLSAEFQPPGDASLLPPTASIPAAAIPTAAVPTAAIPAVPIAAVPAIAPLAAVPAPIAEAGPMPIDAALVDVSAAPIVAAFAAPVGLTDAQWRVELDNIIRARVPVTERIHHRFGRIPERKLTAAIGAYAQGASPGDVLVLLDNTMQGTGRNGFVMTSKDLYYFGGQHGDRGRAAVRDIRDARAPDQATILVSLFSGGLARILASCVKASVPYLAEFFNQIGRLNAAAGASEALSGSGLLAAADLATDDDVVEDVEIVDDAGGGGTPGRIEALLRELFPHDVKACCYRRDGGIPNKALAGATSVYAMGVQPAQVLALFDNTGVLSGECGLLFTPQRLYYHSESSRKAGQIPYAQIRSAEDDSRGDSRVILLRTISGATIPIEYEVARNHGAALLELFRRISATG